LFSQPWFQSFLNAEIAENAEEERRFRGQLYFSSAISAISAFKNPQSL